MRRYPDRVRTVILDGAVPPQVALGPDVAIEAQRAIDFTLQRCTRDAACAHAAGGQSWLWEKRTVAAIARPMVARLESLL